MGTLLGYRGPVNAGPAHGQWTLLTQLRLPSVRIQLTQKGGAECPAAGPLLTSRLPSS